MNDTSSGIARNRMELTATGHLKRFSGMDWMVRYFYPSSFRNKLIARSSGFWDQVMAPFEMAVPGFGDVVGSAEDLGRFMRFHLDLGDPFCESILASGRRKQMQDLREGPFAWGTRVDRGHQVYEHVGGGPGFKAHLLVVPSLRFGMAVLSNRFVGAALDPFEIRAAAQRSVTRSG